MISRLETWPKINLEHVLFDAKGVKKVNIFIRGQVLCTHGKCSCDFENVLFSFDLG